MPILILTHFDDINPEQASDTRCYPTTNPLWKLMFICGCLFRLVWNTLFHMQSSVSTGMEPFSFIRRRWFRRVHANKSQTITAESTSTTTFTTFLEIHKPLSIYFSYAAVSCDWYGTHFFICSRQFRPVWSHSVSYVVVGFDVCMQINRKQ